MKLDFLQRSWGFQRNVYLTQGLHDLVHEGDALLADEEKVLHAPATFEHEWLALQAKLRSASEAKLNEQGGIAAAPLLEWVEFATNATKDRHEKVRASITGMRGMLYTGFLLCAQAETKDWHLASLKGMRPDINSALGAEIRDGLGAKLVEQRVRQLAAATMRVVENFYKPLVSIICTLSGQVAGDQAAVPRMCGQIMNRCQDLWRRTPDILPLHDFLDWDALEVRNGIAHPTKTRFDVAASELVFAKDGGAETRLSEEDLRRRLAALMARCMTMEYALRWIWGEVPAALLRTPGVPPP